MSLPIEVDDLGRTTVPHVYAAGDAASRVHQAIVAAATGTRGATLGTTMPSVFELGWPPAQPARPRRLTGSQRLVRAGRPLCGTELGSALQLVANE